MTFQQFIAILRGRWWVMALLFIVFVGLAVTWSLIRPKMYTASATMMVDLKLTDPVGGRRLPSELIPQYVATQLDLLASERVAVKVVERLKLLDRPVEVTETDEKEVDNRPRREPRFELAGQLLKKLKARPSSASNLIEISFEDRSPEWAAKIANEFTRAYKETSISIATSGAKDSQSFFEKQAAAARGELENTQKRLTKLQQDRGITSTDENADVENIRLQDIARELTAAESALAQSRSNARLGGTGETLTEVLKNPLIQTLKSDLSSLEALMSQRGASLGRNHPEMRRMRQQATTLRARVAAEIRTIKSSVNRGFEVSKRRVDALRFSYNAQRERVLSVKQGRDEIAVVQRDVEAAQTAYQDLQKKASAARVEANVTQSSIDIIAEATVPVLPSSPNLKRNVIIAAVLATLAGLGSIFLFELLQGRIRVVEDLERASKGTVLGTIRALPMRSMRDMKALAPLIDHDLESQPKRLAMQEQTQEQQQTQTTTTARGAQSGDGQSFSENVGNIQRHASVGGRDDGDVAVAADVSVGGGGRNNGGAFDGQPEDGDAGAPGASGRPGNETNQKGRELALSNHSRDLMPMPSSTTLSRTSSVSPEVIAAFDASHPMLDDMRVLRSQLKTRWLNRGNDFHALAVVSPQGSEGKTFAAANLAVTFAQIGNRTLLIDADLRGGRIHDMFALPNDRGLSTMLSLESSPGDSIHGIAGMPALSIVTTGPVTHNPSDLLERDNFSYLIDIFRESFDVVILDTPATDLGPDASLIVSVARGYMIVAREHQSMTRAVEKLVQTMEPLGATQIGSALIRA